MWRKWLTIVIPAGLILAMVLIMVGNAAQRRIPANKAAVNSSRQAGPVEPNPSISHPLEPVNPLEQIQDVPPDIQKILKRGKLIVGVYYKDRPPFFMTNQNGELYGSDIGMARDIGLKLGVGVEFNRKAETYQELIAMVAQGEVDLAISQISRTFERAKYVSFSRPYIRFKMALMVNRITAVKKKIEDYPMDYLRETTGRVGVLTGTSYEEFSRNLFKNAKFQGYDEWKDIVTALVKGEIIAAIDDESEVIREMRQNPDVALYTNIFLLKDQEDEIAIAVNYRNTHLLEWVNTYLEMNHINQDINALIKEYPEVFSESH